MLRMQLDVLQVENNALQAENRKLRADRPDKASKVDLESELAATYEENVRRSQIVAQLEDTIVQRGKVANCGCHTVLCSPFSDLRFFPPE